MYILMPLPAAFKFVLSLKPLYNIAGQYKLPGHVASISPSVSGGGGGGGGSGGMPPQEIFAYFRCSEVLLRLFRLLCTHAELSRSV